MHKTVQLMESLIKEKLIEIKQSIHKKISEINPKNYIARRNLSVQDC